MSDIKCNAPPVTRLRDRIDVHLRLGRVSNLPTVWSNVLAAAFICGGTLSIASVSSLLLACSALYVGGMYLNDAWDADIDALERTERPIPSGLISQGLVLRWCVGWFALGLSCFVIARTLAPDMAGAGGSTGFAASLIAPLALLGCIIAYNRYHKNNPFGPVLMAGCRALVYLSVSYTLAHEPLMALWIGASLAFLWIMALTALAKRESRALAGQSSNLPNWPVSLLAAPIIVSLVLIPRISVAAITVAAALALVIVIAKRWMRSGRASQFARAIGLLIAGIALVDALAILRAGDSMLAFVAVGCAGLTVLLQRRISGT